MGYLVRLTPIIGTAALIAGCGGLQPPLGASGAMPQRSAIAARHTKKKYKVVYTFGKAPDGNYPDAGLINVGGVLYGTTQKGGTNCGSTEYVGCGTVFSVTTGGTENVIYSFSGPDGSGPDADLIDVNGTLYGTTDGGGSGGSGTVYGITTTGTENVLHSFTDSPDGAHPHAALINVNGSLYGTTYSGGVHSRGTVFSVTTGGTEKVLHSLGGSQTSGKDPWGGLIDAGGTLFGTTAWGGVHGNGTVFSITPRGTYKHLYSFLLYKGARPKASLIEVNGTLYGTTVQGGSNSCSNSSNENGCGTVFSITTSGTEQVLHIFGNGTDGRLPYASLIEVDRTLYGTTNEGGTYNHGTVFSVTTDGTEKVLHNFGNPPDGAYPTGDLISVNGTLYGTTTYGGNGKCGFGYGCGTVFALTP